MALNALVFNLLSIAVFICAIGVRAQDGPSVGANVMGRQLSLRVVVTDKGAIRADALLRNASDATITFNGTGRHYDLGWIVSNAGHDVPRRIPKDQREASLSRAEEMLSLRPIALEPKAIKEYSVDLRKLYDFLPDNE